MPEPNRETPETELRARLQQTRPRVWGRGADRALGLRSQWLRAAHSRLPSGRHIPPLARAESAL